MADLRGRPNHQPDMMTVLRESIESITKQLEDPASGLKPGEREALNRHAQALIALKGMKERGEQLTQEGLSARLREENNNNSRPSPKP